MGIKTLLWDSHWLKHYSLLSEWSWETPSTYIAGQCTRSTL